MTRTASPVQTLRARLGALRRRIHALFALQGLGRLVAALVGLLAAYFLADRLLDLPLGVRRFVRLGLLDRPDGMAFVAWAGVLLLAVLLAVWAARGRLGAAPVLAFLAGGLVGLAVWMAWRLLGPAGRPVSDEALALSVERRYRSLNDRLAAALDFDAELAHPTRGESTAMMEQVVAEAAEEARHLEFARAVSARRALLWVGIALAALVVSTGAALAMQETVALWARRSLLLQDEAWPRSTTVLAVDLDERGGFALHDPEVPYEVAVGRPLVVHAHVRGRTPDEVLLLDRVEGARPIPRRLFEIPEHESLYAVEIRDVRQSFAFVLRAGDDEDDLPRYEVVTVVPPRLLAIRSTLSYPAYLAREDEVVEGGNVVVPQGTAVRIEVTADERVARARLVAGDRAIEGRALDEEGRGFAFEVPATETLRYRMQLVTEKGLESDPAADTYEIRVEPDREPDARWVYPERTVDLAANARVPLLAVAEDDHGVTAITLEARFGEDRTRRWTVVPAGEGSEEALGAADGPLGRPRIRLYHPFEIASLRDEDGSPPAAPTRIGVRLIVTDSKGQTHEGAWTHLDLLVPLDLERALGTRRASVRTRFEGLLEDARRRREQLAAASAGPVGESERDALRSIQFAQAKIAQDLDEATQDLLRLFNGWIFNRLGPEGPIEKILALMDRFHRRTYGLAAPDETGEGDAAPAIEPGDPVFPYALYDEILRARRERVFFDTGLVDRMLQVLEPAVDAAARLAPLAHDAMRRVAAGEAEPALALAAQDALIHQLEATLEGMSSWKRLNDVITHLRRIIDQQNALDERLRDRVEGEPSRSR